MTYFVVCVSYRLEVYLVIWFDYKYRVFNENSKK